MISDNSVVYPNSIIDNYKNNYLKKFKKSKRN